MRGATLPLPQYVLWCGSQLKHRDNFTSTFILHFESQHQQLNFKQYHNFSCIYKITAMYLFLQIM